MRLRCGRCEKVKDAKQFNRRGGSRTGHAAYCRQCQSEYKKEYMQRPEYKQHKARYVARERERRARMKEHSPQKVWAQDSVRRLRRRAKQKGIECTLDRDWLLDNLPGRCPLLKEAFNFAKVTNDWSPTVDRISVEEGYTPENSWIISAKANRIKNNGTWEEIMAVAEGLRDKISGD